MKIAWVSNSPLSPTGFGQQVRLVATELEKLGYENVIVCRPHTLQEPRPFPEYHVADYVCDPIDETLADIQPDAVICLDGHRLLANLMEMKVTPANCPVYYWWPFEGSCVPPDMGEIFNGVPDEFIVHLSKFATDLWPKGKTVIGHAVDPAFKPLEVDKAKLRKKWARKFRIPLFPDSFLIFNINRNFIHKNWDKLIYLVKLLKDEGLDAQLLGHTSEVMEEQWGGKNLPEVARMFKVSDDVFFTKGTLSPAEINELMNMSDIRVDTSAGEGFGLTVLEAYSAGLPQLVNNHTTMPEVLEAEPQCLVEPASYSVSMGSTWADPDVREMAKRVKSGAKYDYNFRPTVTPADIAQLWDKHLKSSKLDCWKELRFGHHRQYRHTVRLQTVARLAKAMKWNVLEIGSYNGAFVEWCKILGVGILGIESPENAGNIPGNLTDFISITDYLSPWPSADALIMTDVHDLLLGPADTAAATEFLSRIQTYPQVIVSFNPCFKFGQTRFNPNQLKAYLTASGHQRLEDTEVMVRKKLPMFSHEIWSMNPISLPRDF